MEVIEVETGSIRCPHCGELLARWDNPPAGRCEHLVFSVVYCSGDDDALLYARPDFSRRLVERLGQIPVTPEEKNDEYTEPLTEAITARFLRGDYEPGDEVSIRLAHEMRSPDNICPPGTVLYAMSRHYSSLCVAVVQAAGESQKSAG